MDVPFSSISVRVESCERATAWHALKTVGDRARMARRDSRAWPGTDVQQGDPGSSPASPRAGEGPGDPRPGAATVPDALKFANGLLRQKKV